MIAEVFAALCIVVSQAHLVHNEHEQYRARPPPINPNHLDQRSPSEVMVDLSNDLAYKVLHLHSILNRNNFAFSPTALMCVMVALYEGSAGRSSLEMRNAMQMPNNRDVIRVGYRDIHRRLRTYFFGEDNPLRGLSLNKENVTITSEYETILKFYGYDLGMDMVSSTTASYNYETPKTTPSPEIQTTRIPSTYLPTVLPGFLPKTSPITSTTQAPTYLPTTPSTTPPTTTVATSTLPTTTLPTTTLPTTTPAPPTSPAREEPPSTTSTEYVTSTSLQPPFEESTTLETETTLVSEIPQSFTTTTFETTKETSTPTPQESDEVVTLKTFKDTPQEENANLKKFKTSGKLISPRLDYLPPKYTQVRVKSSKRTRRHLFGLKGLDPSFFLNFIQPRTQYLQAPPPEIETIEIEAPPQLPPAQDIRYQHPTPQHLTIPILPIQNAYLDVEQGFLSPSKEPLNNEVVDHIFYINNLEVIHTTFKVYNSVLYYKYFDQLKITIIELELDSIDYNLMILLPDYDIDLLTAASNLRLGPTLRSIRKQLQPRWVQAIIPDFQLHGTIFLTNDLQNLGICDIFEPNRADFRPMTDENGIYVKHIEQTIDVNIRTRPINHLKRSYGSQTQPIQVSVNHPFMFFIIDRDLDVATMTGRILNPLNVRIQ